MAFFNAKAKTATAVISFFFLIVALGAFAGTPVEQACLQFADELWFTAGNARINTPAKNCHWNGNSFKVRGVIVRTYMTISFWPDFWANPPSREYLKEHLAEEIIGNSNYGDGDPQIGDEEENSISWSKLNEAPVGDYGIISEYGSQWNSVETTDFYFLVDGCTVKIGGSAVPERQQDAEELDYYDYLKQITTEKAQEIAEKLKNEPLCKIGSKPSETIPPSPAEDAPNPSPYAVCAIQCLDEADTRYQCALPSPVIDDEGVAVVVLPDGSTQNFFPSHNECVADRGKTQSDCLSQCPASVGGEPISDPIGDSQPIKVAGTAADDPLNEAGKYLNLLKRKPAIPDKDYGYLKTIFDDDGTERPISADDVKGEPQMQVPGSDEWVTLKKDDVIPRGARIFTGMDDGLLVNFPRLGIVKVLAFTDITFDREGVSSAMAKGEFVTDLDLRTGDVEVRVDKKTYQVSGQVRTPQSVTSVRGTHFWVSYDETKRLGAVGVYEGEVVVDDLFRGTRTLLTPAKDTTPRVVVMPSTDSALAQEEENSQLQTQEQQKGNVLFWILIIMVLGGGAFVLFKTGKLQPMLKKVLVLVRRDNSKPF